MELLMLAVTVCAAGLLSVGASAQEKPGNIAHWNSKHRRTEWRLIGFGNCAPSALCVPSLPLGGCFTLPSGHRIDVISNSLWQS